MRDNPSPATFLNDDSLRRNLRGLAVGITLFVVLGTVTAVWANPLFVRMTPVGPWEFVATVLTAFLGGVTAAMWVPQCNLRASGTGGLASFLGIACQPATSCSCWSSVDLRFLPGLIRSGRGLRPPGSSSWVSPRWQHGAGFALSALPTGRCRDRGALIGVT